MWSYALLSLPFHSFGILIFFPLIFSIKIRHTTLWPPFILLSSPVFFTLPSRLQSTPAAPPPSVSAVVAPFSQFAFWNHLLEFLLVLLFSSVTFILHLTFFLSHIFSLYPISLSIPFPKPREGNMLPSLSFIFSSCLFSSPPARCFLSQKRSHWPLWISRM